MESTYDTFEEASKDTPKVSKSDVKKLKELGDERVNLKKMLKKETDILKKNDIKKKIIKNEKDFREAIKDLSSDQKAKCKKFFKNIGNGSADSNMLMNLAVWQQMLNSQQNDFQQQMRNQEMMNQQQMLNQQMINQQMLMNQQMMGF